MTELAMKTAAMIDCLPQQEQMLAYEVLSRIVLAWDPEFTKLTTHEVSSLIQAEYEIENGDTVSDEDINWDAD